MLACNPCVLGGRLPKVHCPKCVIDNRTLVRSVEWRGDTETAFVVKVLLCGSRSGDGSCRR